MSSKSVQNKYTLHAYTANDREKTTKNYIRVNVNVSDRIKAEPKMMKRCACRCVARQWQDSNKHNLIWFLHSLRYTRTRRAIMVFHFFVVGCCFVCLFIFFFPFALWVNACAIVIVTQIHRFVWNVICVHDNDECVALPYRIPYVIAGVPQFEFFGFCFRLSL